MGAMPFLATCHTCKLLYRLMFFLLLFEWRIKFSLSVISESKSNPSRFAINSFVFVLSLHKTNNNSRTSP